MKKTAIVMALLFLLQSAWAFAAETPEDLQKDIERIEIAFQIGSDILKINGSDTQVETAPYVVGEGVTMVPIRVITEAFGAVVEWNEEEQSITITYEGVEMRLVVGSIEATINGRSLTVLSPPEVYNDRTMVPLRFISENFGADVSYDGETESVLVVKESFGDEDLDNYNSILKKTDKERVGDSYYGWSMRIPKELRLTERSFDGAATYFTSDYVTLGIEIVAVEDEEEEFSLDKLYIAMKEEASTAPNTFISQNKGMQGQHAYCEVSFRDTKYQYDQRAYYINNKIYYLWAIRDLQGGSAEVSVLEEAKQSFEIGYAYPNDTEDLSNVRDGMRPFKDGVMNISTEIPADWMMLLGSPENRMGFIQVDGKFYGKFYIDIFSKEAGETATSWANEDLERYDYLYNSKFVNFNGPNPITISGRSGVETKIVVNPKAKGHKLTTRFIYLTNENYKCRLTLTYDNLLEENNADYAKVNQMISNFVFVGPDASLGTLQEPPMEFEDDTVVDTVKLSDGKYKMKVPTTWVKESSNGIDLFTDGIYSVLVASYKDVPNISILRSAYVQAMNKQFPEAEYSSSSPRKLKIPKATVTELFYTRPISDESYAWLNTYVYIVKTSYGDYFTIECQVPDVYDSQRAEDLFTSIVTSLEKV